MAEPIPKYLARIRRLEQEEVIDLGEQLDPGRWPGARTTGEIARVYKMRPAEAYRRLQALYQAGEIRATVRGSVTYWEAPPDAAANV